MFKQINETRFTQKIKFDGVVLFAIEQMCLIVNPISGDLICERAGVNTCLALASCR